MRLCHFVIWFALIFGNLACSRSDNQSTVAFVSNSAGLLESWTKYLSFNKEEEKVGIGEYRFEDLERSSVVTTSWHCLKAGF